MKKVLAVTFIVTLFIAVISGITPKNTAEKPQSVTSNIVGQITSAEVVEATTSISATPVANPSDKLGEVIRRSISPYTAQNNFGTIYMNNKTTKTVDIETELTTPLDIKIFDTKEPQVLIMHTHATESYMEENRDYYTKNDRTHSDDTEQNIVKIGAVIAEKLRENGIAVIHDKTLYDGGSYTGSYERSGEGVEKVIKKNPSIKVVLDIHRDAVASGETGQIAPICEVNGKTAAQIMLVMGCNDGSITTHENWRQNLRLALRFQQAAELKYKGFARPLSLVPRQYNQNLTKGSMLIEVGTQVNTFEEAEYSAELTGDLLVRILKGLK